MQKIIKDVFGDYSKNNAITNSEILDSIIKEAKNQGYEFKLLDQFQ